MTPTITINSKDYAVAELSEAAKAQIANIQVADAELARLQQQLETKHQKPKQKPKDTHFILTLAC